MTHYLITDAQLQLLRTSRMQHLDRGDTAAAAALDWVLRVPSAPNTEAQRRRYLAGMNWRSSREAAVELALADFDRKPWWRKVWIVATGHRFWKTFRDAVETVPGFVRYEK